MKRVLLIFIILLMFIFIVSCGSDDEVSEKSTEKSAETTTEKSDDGGEEGGGEKEEALPPLQDVPSEVERLSDSEYEKKQRETLNVLLDGVSKVAPGIRAATKILILDKSSYKIGVNKTQAFSQYAYMAGGFLGKGYVFATGLSPEKLLTTFSPTSIKLKFIQNILKLANLKENTPIIITEKMGKRAINKKVGTFITLVADKKSQNYNAEKLLDPRKYPVAMINAKIEDYQDCSELYALLEKYVYNGGVVLIGDLLSSWNSEKIKNSKFNAFLGKAGLGLSEYSVVDDDIKTIDVTVENLMSYHPANALKIAKEIQKKPFIKAEEFEKLTGVKIDYSNGKDETEAIGKAFYAYAQSIAPLIPKEELEDENIIKHLKLPKTNWPMTNDIYTRALFIAYTEKNAREGLNPDQKKSIYADVYPGKVKEGGRITKTLDNFSIYKPERTIYAHSFGYRQSTGLYVPPGENIKITVTHKDGPKQDGDFLFVRVGHDYNLNPFAASLKKTVKRVLKVSFGKRIGYGETVISSAYGGILYFKPEVPFEQKAHITIKVEGAVEMPTFIYKKTTQEQWEKALKESRAPWVEFIAGTVIIDTPLETALMGVKDAQTVGEMYYRVGELTYDLMGLTKDTKTNPRPGTIKDDIANVRYNQDAHINAGWMHSGYPIASFTDLKILNIRNKEGKKAYNLWGSWHELGHNTQLRQVGLPATGEVTVNLNSLYHQYKDGLEYRTVKFDWFNKNETLIKEKMSKGEKLDWLKDFNVGTRLPFYHAITLIDYYLNGNEEWSLYTKIYKKVFAGKPLGGSNGTENLYINASEIIGRDIYPIFKAYGATQYISDKIKKQVSSKYKLLEQINGKKLYELKPDNSHMKNGPYYERGK